MPLADPAIREGLPVAKLPARGVDHGPLSNDQYARLCACWARLPRRSRYVLTARLGMAGAPRMTLRMTGVVLGIGVERTRQLENGALTALAVASHGGDRHAALALRPVIVTVLRDASVLPLS